eukprot:4810285-Amphidinium_carterae.1
MKHSQLQKGCRTYRMRPAASAPIAILGDIEGFAAWAFKMMSANVFSSLVASEWYYVNERVTKVFVCNGTAGKKHQT